MPDVQALLEAGCERWVASGSPSGGEVIIAGDVTMRLYHGTDYALGKQRLHVVVVAPDNVMGVVDTVGDDEVEATALATSIHRCLISGKSDYHDRVVQAPRNRCDYLRSLLGLKKLNWARLDQVRTEQHRQNVRENVHQWAWLWGVLLLLVTSGIWSHVAFSVGRESSPVMFAFCVIGVGVLSMLLQR